MRTFKRLLARLAAMLSFTTMKNDSYRRLSMATRGATWRARADHFLHPLIQKVLNRFSISFFQKMCCSFLASCWKPRKNHAISLLDICEKHAGMAKSAPPPSRARVNQISSHNSSHSRSVFYPLLFISPILQRAHHSGPGGRRSPGTWWTMSPPLSGVSDRRWLEMCVPIASCTVWATTYSRGGFIWAMSISPRTIVTHIQHPMALQWSDQTTLLKQDFVCFVWI